MVGTYVLHYTIRSMTAVIASILIANLFRLPEYYWASITTLIVLQSTAGNSWLIAARISAGTAVGGLVGAIMTFYLGSNVVVFGAGIFVLGLVCAALGKILLRSGPNLDEVVFRFAGVGLAIVMLVPWHESVWAIAGHRAFEVSIGAAVAVAAAYVWPLTESTQPETSR